MLFLGINWLENRIHINCYDKTMMFPEYVEEEVSKFISANQLEKLLKNEAQAVAMFAFLKLDNKEII